METPKYKIGDVVVVKTHNQPVCCEKECYAQAVIISASDIPTNDEGWSYLVKFLMESEHTDIFLEEEITMKL